MMKDNAFMQLNVLLDSECLCCKELGSYTGSISYILVQLVIFLLRYLYYWSKVRTSLSETRNRSMLLHMEAFINGTFELLKESIRATTSIHLVKTRTVYGDTHSEKS